MYSPMSFDLCVTFNIRENIDQTKVELEWLSVLVFIMVFISKDLKIVMSGTTVFKFWLEIGNFAKYLLILYNKQ